MYYTEMEKLLIEINSTENKEGRKQQKWGGGTKTIWKKSIRNN